MLCSEASKKWVEEYTRSHITTRIPHSLGIETKRRQRNVRERGDKKKAESNRQETQS